MDNPYQPDPEALERNRRTAQEERLILLQETEPLAVRSVQPSLISTWLFGPAANQPLAGDTRFPDGWKPFVMRGFIWLWIVLFSLGILVTVGTLFR